MSLDEEAPHIAVIGMAGRFPGATTLEEFWDNLVAGREMIVDHSKADLLAWGEDPALVEDAGYVTRRGSLENPADFDAELFGFSVREATVTDPQQRLFLECAWEALEDAGCDPSGYPGSIGVYGSATPSSYARVLRGESELAPGGRTVTSLDAYQFLIATLSDHIATRVSYKLGLTGPSLEIGATCAGSLVAVHVAAQALLGGECDVALAGGASVLVPPRGAVSRDGGTLSPRGRIRAFDAAADGMVGGDAVGVVVLKRLVDAVADRDRIRAVVRGSAVNNLGSARAGYTAPAVDGQARVIRAAQQVAEVDPATVTYIEAHGTGTPVGDPIEVAALDQVFADASGATGQCALGSVKTNIGHTDAAAGVAGLIKVVLAMQHRMLPPTLHFTTPNPEIDLEHGPFTIATELRAWQPEGRPLRAGVSSFGIGGTNVHVVLEEAAPAGLPGPALPASLLVVSGMTGSALAAVAANLADHLEGHPDTELADVAFTLQTGRRALSHRAYAVCADRPGAIRALRDIASGSAHSTADSDSRTAGRDVVLVLPGDGPVEGVARELYAHSPSFAAHLDDAAAATEKLGIDIRTVLCEGTAQADGSGPAAALFGFDYAIAMSFLDWGVAPAGVIGHGVGDVAAACVSRVSDLDEAVSRLDVVGRTQMPGGPDSGDRLLVELHPGLDGALDTLGRLWVAGVPVEWTALPGNRSRNRVSLPTYPFERRRYLLELPAHVPPGADPLRAEPAEPAGGIRERLAVLYAEVLGVTEVDPDDDFFDLGGDSLNAAQLASRISETLGVDVPMETFFDAPTFAEFAGQVAELAGKRP